MTPLLVVDRPRNDRLVAQFLLDPFDEDLCPLPVSQIEQYVPIGSTPPSKVARGSIANVLKERGLEPAPERKKRTTWREFLAAHWDVLAAADLASLSRSGRHAA